MPMKPPKPRAPTPVPAVLIVPSPSGSGWRWPSRLDRRVQRQQRQRRRDEPRLRILERRAALVVDGDVIVGARVDRVQRAQERRGLADPAPARARTGTGAGRCDGSAAPASRSVTSPVSFVPSGSTT